MLYLCGNVKIYSKIADSQSLQKITVNNAQINLVTQDILSNDKVTLYGKKFHSIGLRMRGNLRKKYAKLIEKVITTYEIHIR